MGKGQPTKTSIGMALMLLGFAVSLTAVAQDEPRKSELSHKPLNTEQIAVYRAVIEDYRSKYRQGRLNVANQTIALDQPGRRFEKPCRRGFSHKAAEGTTAVVHKLGPEVATGLSVLLVDSARQEKEIAENDPQNLVENALRDGGHLTGQQIHDSVNKAFETGLLTLSEIIFDKHQRHALVEYDFDCGRLCGNGRTLILKKVGRKWKVGKRCGGWVS
jgi:hypothetical protein